MTKRARRRILLVTIPLAVIIGGVLMFRHLQHGWIYETALVWSRMAPVPATAMDWTFETRGSMFTRQCIVSFTAPLPDIDAWLAASLGTADVTPTRDGTIRTYTIEPGDGAVSAEVIVDEQTGQVTIDTSWS